MSRPARAELHREVYRPWGKYDSIDAGDHFQVKRITVNPGGKLSVQMHHHRSEHWVVVSGTAHVGDEETLVLTENESVYLSGRRNVHFGSKTKQIPLELIEVQTESYLGEDDIVQFEDQYGQADRERYPSDGLPIAESGGCPNVADPRRGWGRLHRVPHDEGIRSGGPRAGRVRQPLDWARGRGARPGRLHWSLERDRLSQIVGDAWNFYRRCDERKH